MASKDPLAEQLDSIIAKIVTDLESRNTLLISPENVANEVDKFIDPDGAAPELKTYCSTMQIRQSTRAYLRKRHDPVGRMEQQMEEGIEDMFSDQLQPYYPVKRLPNGDPGIGYARRDTLTEEEVDVCASRMRKAGTALLAHANALMAWNATRKPTG